MKKKNKNKKQLGGLGKLLDKPHQFIVQAAGGNGDENYSDIIARKRQEQGSLQQYLDSQGYGLVNDVAAVAGDLVIDPLNLVGVKGVKALNGNYFSAIDKTVKAVKTADNVNDVAGIYNQVNTKKGKKIIPNPQVINPIKQYGGKQKTPASTTARSYVPKAKILDTTIDLNSLTPEELAIPGVRDAVFGNTTGATDPAKAQALVWMNRQNGNPTTKRFYKDSKGRVGRAEFDLGTNTAYANTVDEYLAELAHANQLKQGDVYQSPVAQMHQMIDYEQTYKIPGSVEWDAHQVIEPKLKAQYDALKMSKSQKDSFIKRKLSMQHGGKKKPNVKAEKGEIFRDENGVLNQVSPNAPSHDDPEGGVDLYGVESVLSDSYSQVQSGDRKSSIKEKIVKLDPQQVTDMATRFGIKYKAGKSMSPSKAFEEVRKERDKLQQKYVKKTADQPTNDLFAQNTYRLNLRFGNQLPTDNELYDSLFQLQEENKSMAPELFNQGRITEDSQFGGMIDDVSMQGYNYDSPYNQSQSLMIQGGMIDMSRTDQNLALIPVNDGIPQYEDLQIGQAWNDSIYDLDSDQVLEVPLSQYGGRRNPQYYDPSQRIGLTAYADNLPPVSAMRPVAYSEWGNSNPNGFQDPNGFNNPFVPENTFNVDPVIQRPSNPGVANKTYAARKLYTKDQYKPTPIKKQEDGFNARNPYPNGFMNEQGQLQPFINSSTSPVPAETQAMVIGGKKYTVTKTPDGNWTDGRGNTFTWNENTRKYTRNTNTDGYLTPEGEYKPFVRDTRLPSQRGSKPAAIIEEKGKAKEVFHTSNGYVDSDGRKRSAKEIKAKAKKGEAQITQPQEGISWDGLQNIDTSNLPGMNGKLLPLEEKNVIDKKAQTTALLKSWGSKDFPADKQKFVRENKQNKRKPIRFDFSSPEQDVVNGMALGESYQTTPPLRQRANLYAAQQKMIDPTPYLQEIASQNASMLQNVNTNSSAGQAYMAQIDANRQRQTAQVLGEIQRANNQIDYMNQQNLVQTYNQETMYNQQLDKRYYDESLATQEASRQQRANALANWANSASQRRRFLNNLKMQSFIAPDFFNYDDLELIGNRNNNKVVFY